MSQPTSRITEVIEQIEQVQSVLDHAHQALEAVEHAEITVKKAGRKAKGKFGRTVILVALLGGAAYAANKYLINSASRDGHSES